MQIRSFRGSGEPVWVNAHLLSARDCLGPDPRRALGPAATPAASTGRTRDRTRPMLQKCQKVLAMAPSTRGPTETCREILLSVVVHVVPGLFLGEIDLAQDSRNRVFLYQMDRYPGGQFPYAAFFWPALAAASAGEIGSSFAAHFLGFSGDANGDHTPQEPEGATPSKIALELHAIRLPDFTVAQRGVPNLLCTPLALHGATIADLAAPP